VSDRVAVAESTIVIVDDEPRNVLLLERILIGAGFTRVHSALDPRMVPDLCREARPDLLIVDLHMPGLDGVELIGLVTSALPEERYLPVLVLTADATEAAKRRALEAGAHDFLTKPFGITEAVLRIRNLLETRALYLRLEQTNAELSLRVAERTRELEATRLEVLERLCQAVEFRDDVTGQHTRRVAERSADLAARVGLPGGEVDLIRRAAPLHDVGKIAIPDSILMKPGRLSDEEFAVMRRHTTLGGQILSGGRSPLMALAESIALRHHERWDGGGYPGGLAGESIPVAARVVAIADVFDALTNPRQYRAAWPPSLAVREIQKSAGSHFDPRLAQVFVGMIS
jgi:putative two-component system response regulator